MANFNVLNLTQGTNEWLEARREHITATEIASLYIGRISLYELISRKRGIAKSEDLTSNPAVQQGKYFEPIILQEVVKKYPSLLNKGEFEVPQPCVESIEEPFFMASLDGYSQAKNVVIEIKNIFSKAEDRFLDIATNGLKAKAVQEYGYYFQIQWQLAVTNCPIALLFFHRSNDGKSFNPNNFIGMKIPRNEKVIAELKKLALQVKNILSNNLEVTPSKGDTIYLTKEQEENIADELHALQAITSDYELANKLYKSLEAKRKELISKLAAKFVADNETCKIRGKNFFLSKTQRQGSVDYEKLKQALNIESIDEFRKEPTLELRIKFD